MIFQMEFNFSREVFLSILQLSHEKLRKSIFPSHRGVYIFNDFCLSEYWTSAKS